MVGSATNPYEFFMSILIFFIMLLTLFFNSACAVDSSFSLMQVSSVVIFGGTSGASGGWLGVLFASCRGSGGQCRILVFGGGATSRCRAPPRVFCNNTRTVSGWIFLACQLGDEAFELPKFAIKFICFSSNFLANDIVKEILVDAGFGIKAGLSGIS